MALGDPDRDCFAPSGLAMTEVVVFDSQDPGLRNPNLLAIELNQDGFRGFFDEKGFYPDVRLRFYGEVEPKF